MQVSNWISSVWRGLAGWGVGVLVVAVVVAILAAQSAVAITTIWSGSSTGGVFNDDANWTHASPGDNLPYPNGANDLFNSGTNVDGTITFDADADHYRTMIQNPGGTIAFDTGDHKWTMAGYFLVGAESAPGFPKIRHIGGEIQAEFLLFGSNETSPNPLFELTGSTTHFHTTRGSGGYQIGLGPVVDGATMLVHNGASMTADGQVIIGLQGSSNSKLTIDGVGAELVAGNYLGVGHTGAGWGPNATNNQAEIINGATAVASHILMAITPGAPNNTLTVSGAGSKLTLSGVGGESAIGRQGNNNLFQIDNGAVVDGGAYFVLGRETSSNNNQILLDDGSLTGTGIEIRRGNVTVTNGSVDLNQFYNEEDEIWEGGGIIAIDAGTSSFTFNNGTVHSVNADINNGEAFTVGDGGSATYFMKTGSDGNRGTHSFADGVSLSSNAVLSGDGNIAGDVSGTAGAVVEVGESTGLINVNGAWDNTGVDIGLELADLSTSLVPGEEHDRLDITGVFTHGGSVTIDISGYVAPSSQPLKLIGWGGQAGNSSDTSVLFVGGGPLPVEYLSDGLYVTLDTVELAGDYNGDGTVNAADYTIWADTLGETVVPGTGADGVDDGFIDKWDYELWKDHFGSTIGAASGSSLSGQSAVPEPAGWVLCLGLAVVGNVRAARRHLLKNIDHPKNSCG